MDSPLIPDSHCSSEDSDEKPKSANDSSEGSSDESWSLEVVENSIWDAAHVRMRRANFYDKIHECYQKVMYTDVDVICRDEFSFRCHRLALDAASEYFHDKFRELPGQDIVLRDIDSPTFRKILKYVYEGKIASINDDDVFSLLQASDILRLSDIEYHCVHYLTQQNIPIGGAMKIFYFASARKKNSLIPALSKFILENIDLFRVEIAHPNMSLENFRLLLTYFRASSVSHEAKLLNLIISWVRSLIIDVREEMKSTFEDLVRMVRFEFMSANEVAEYFERNCSVDVGYLVSQLDLSDIDSNGIEFMSANEVAEYFEMNRSVDFGKLDSSSDFSDLDWNGTKVVNDVSLHVYLETDESTPDALNCLPTKQTSIFSLRDGWHLCHTIRPAIKKMRIVESGGRLYCLKQRYFDWAFSSSTVIDLSDEQILAPPSGLTVAEKASDRLAPFSLCCLRKNIYVSGSHCNIDLQSYHTELGTWSSIPALSDYVPENIICDDTRLYIIYPPSSSYTYRFAAYDPRVGEVEHLSTRGLRPVQGFLEPGVYHKGRIYLPEDDMNMVEISKFRMAVYDPAADRWDIQDLKCQEVYLGLGRRLISFNNRIWMFGLDSPPSCSTDPNIYVQIYDSYLQGWNKEYYRSTSLYKALSHSNLKCTNFMDVIAFKLS